MSDRTFANNRERRRVNQQPDLSFMRTLATHSPTRLVGAMFVGSTVDSKFWTASTNGAGAAATQGSGHVTLASGTANDGYANLRTVQAARFVFAHPLIARLSVNIPDTTVADCSRLWGAYTVTGTPPVPQNGYWFELDPDGTLNIAYAKDGAITKVPSGAFNGIVQDYTLNTLNHAFEIHYFVMRAEWYIDNVLIHAIDTSQVTSSHIVNDWTLPVQATCKNSAAGVTSGTVRVHAGIVMREGLLNTDSIYYHLAGAAGTHVLKLGPGRLHKVIYNNTSGTTLTMYDNTAASGAVIGVITTASAALGVWDYNLPFFTGRTLVTVGNSLDATIVYE